MSAEKNKTEHERSRLSIDLMIVDDRTRGFFAWRAVVNGKEIARADGFSATQDAQREAIGWLFEEGAREIADAAAWKRIEEGR